MEDENAFEFSTDNIMAEIQNHWGRQSLATSEPFTQTLG